MSSESIDIVIPELPPISADFDSFVEAASSMQYSPQELEARFRAKAGYARNPSGDYVYRLNNGSVGSVNYPRTGTLEEVRQVSKGRQAVIRSVRKNVESLNSTSVSLRDTASYLSDVIAARYSAAELEARFRAKAGYARNPSGDYVYRLNNGSVGSVNYPRTGTLEEVRVATGDQREIIRYVAQSARLRTEKQAAASATVLGFSIVSKGMSVSKAAEQAKERGYDNKLASELVALANLRGDNNSDNDAVVAEILRTGNDTGALRLIASKRQEVADLSDMSNIMADLTTAEAYVQIARRINIRSAFWGRVQAGRLAEAQQALDEYIVVDDTDTVLIGELRAEALVIRRDQAVVDAFVALGKNEPDFNAASTSLQAITALSQDLVDPKGLEIAAYAANTAYDAEVNVFFGRLIGQLGIDQNTISQVVAQLEAAPVRPAVASVDYFEKFEAAKADFLAITGALSDFAFEKQTVELRKRFAKDNNIQQLLSDIVTISGDSDEGLALRQNLLNEFTLTVTSRRGLDPARFAVLKTVQLEGIRASRQDSVQSLDLTAANPEASQAVRCLVERFQASIRPLFEAIRGTELGERIVRDYISGRTGRRDLYVQRVEALQRQRDLTDIELAYLESVELLTVFNPHLIALAREAPDLTSLYLERYFTSMDQAVKASLVPDMYIPVVQVGLGPNGVAAAGEMNRINPEVAAGMLYIDANALPGGPFGVAKGPSWELNSANSLSDSTNNLPDILESDANGLSVRSYGSPLVAYPGERREGVDIRQASINVTVDYLPNPDNVSTRRYHTNVDMARILQLQSALLVDNIMLSTRVVGVEKLSDGLPGDTRLWLQYSSASGELVTTTIRTERQNLAGGLGEPSYGFRLEGSGAIDILRSENTGPDGFPLLTDTIDAFAKLSDPEGEPTAPKGVIVVYGKGNSTDVLIEYLGRQFESGNPALNGITKLIVVADGELNRRPRYAQINDLKARNGQPNFLEFVSARVGDVARQADGTLQLSGTDSRPLTAGVNGSRRVIKANHVISAAGFQPELDEVFLPLLSPGESINTRRGLGRLALPSNPGFSIADQLQADPATLILGTASRADFQNPSKLGQLPRQSREALLRNDVGNAVAIGFRTPDTRAAIRLSFTNYRPIQPSQLKARTAPLVADIRSVIGQGVIGRVSRSSQLARTRRTVDADSTTLSALFLEAMPKVVLGTGEQALPANDSRATTQYKLRVSYDTSVRQFVFSSPDSAIPRTVFEAASNAVADPYFQAYALKALRGRRTDRGLEVALAFNRGRLQYRDPGGANSRRGRTYVEAL